MPIFQLTGLSGAGKTTLATRVAEWLQAKGMAAEVIDGDCVPQNHLPWLGLYQDDRLENIRRLGAAANALSNEGKVVLIAATSPFQEARRQLENQYGAKTVFIQCSLEVLRQRDTKDLYRKAGLPEGHPDKVQLLTGVSDVYEVPVNPHLIIDTERNL